MKKVLALVLASVMVVGMGVTAMAAPKGTLTFDTDTSADGKIYLPVHDSGIAATDETFEDVKVTVKVTEGKEYVKSTKLDEIESKFANGTPGYGVIVTLQDYYQTDKVTIKFEVKLTNKNGRELLKETFTHKINNTDGKMVELKDGDKVEGGPSTMVKEDAFKWNSTNKEVTVKYPAFNGNVINFGKAEFIELEADYFGFAVKASEQGKLPMSFDNKVVKSVVKVAPADAELTFFNFNGRPSFDFTGKVTIVLPDEDKEYYLYSIDEDGNLAAVAGAALNEDGDAVEFKTRTLGSYVLSDMALETEVEEDLTPEEPTTPTDPEEDKTNPPTGFGVAATIAALAF